MTASEFQSAWPGFSDRWLSFCYANRLTPGVDLPRDHYMPFSMFVTSRILDGNPGIENGTIVDQDEFQRFLWGEAEVQRERIRNMNTQERNQLLSEKTSLEQMLANLPESSVIDRMSLEARKSQVEEAIATALTDCETGRDCLLEALKEALAEVEALTKESIMGVGQKAQHRLWMARMRCVIQDVEECEG